MGSLILTSQEAVKYGHDVLGGKAWNMAWLSRNGFPVPQWCVLTTDAFVKQIQACGLEAFIAEHVAKLDASLPADQIGVIAEAIQNEITKHPLDADICDAIKAALPADKVASQFYAVRSSVVGEDAEGASFAGQMDSHLFQKGFDAIYESVIGVLKSAFNQRALMYRLHKKIPLHDIRAAVIIQEMVEGDVSGVMFTAHPINGSRHHALISASWGCGEGIVSGLCNTDEFTVDLNTDRIEKIINEKDAALVFDTDTGRGTKEIVVDPAKQKIPCLTDAQVIALRNLGRTIGEKKHSPQDIEFAVRGNQLYVLQTRPVTSLPDTTQKSDKLVVWDNSNIQESFNGVTTPLTFSVAVRAYAKVYEEALRVFGVSEKSLRESQDILQNMLGLVRGRVYYNINNWYRFLGFFPSFNTNKADMERMMGLQDPVDFVEGSHLSLAQKIRKMPQMIRALLHLLNGFRRMSRLVVEFKQMFDGVYRGVDRSQLHTKSVGELIEMSRFLDRELLCNWTTPIVNDFYVMMMNGKVHRWLKNAGFEHIDVLQNNLLSGEEGIESTEPTKFLLRLCDVLRRNPPLRKLVEENDNAILLDLIQGADNAFYQECQRYIELYGDRTIGEMKAESITLRQDASFMFAVLKNFLHKEDLSLKTLAENEARFRSDAEMQAYEAIRSQLGSGKLERFKRDLQKCREAIKNRENMRLARTRMVGLYRDIYNEIGRQMAFYGLLDDPTDVLYVTVEELYAYYDGRSVQANWKPLVKARREEFASYEAEDLPHHFHTWGPVYHHNQYEYPFAEKAAAIDANSSTLKGIGCYPGIVEKPIRLIFSPKDELSVDGQILCTVRTDPGWAPLFPTAAGILVERGSTLSHSAVVARELGIPAIVGVPGLTKIVQDRELVRMNGSTGVVERLDQA